MIEIIKENMNDSEKKELISTYENKLTKVDKYISDKLDSIIEDILRLKDTIKYNIVTDEISSFYVDDKSLAIDEYMLDDEFESEILNQEIKRFDNLSDGELDYIINDTISGLFK